MDMVCPKCDTEIPESNINSQTGIGMCANCKEIFRLNAAYSENVHTETVETEKLPENISKEKPHRYCHECGKSLIEGTSFCNNCGTKQSDEAQGENKTGNYSSSRKSENNGTIEYRQKQRHGFLTFIFWTQIIGNSISILSYISGNTLGYNANSSIDILLFGSISPGNIIILSLIIPIMTVISIVLLLNWKKIGFILQVISWVITLIFIPKTGFFGQTMIAIPIIIPLITLALLQLKKNGVSAWNNLE